jgi:alpha-1,6-mannosyltransferase
VLCAYAYWLRHAIKPSIFLFTVTIVIFRGDTAVLFAPVLLWMLLHNAGWQRLFRIVWWGIAATVGALAVTVLVDSYFWTRWLWPEGEVLWLNAVENRSHEWGVSPPLWYFYSALPRALLATLLLVPFGIRYYTGVGRPCLVIC